MTHFVVIFSFTPAVGAGTSNYSRSSQGDQIITVETEFTTIDLFIVLAEQRRRARHSSGRFAQPRHHPELQIFADYRVFHLHKDFSGFRLRALDELARGINRSDGD